MAQPSPHPVIVVVHQASDPWAPYVGLGTLALAVATVGLAYVTFRMVHWTRKTAEAALEDVRATAELVKSSGDQARATQASAEAAREAAQSAAADVELSRRALETQVRPVIVDVPVGSSGIPTSRVYINYQPVELWSYQIYTDHDQEFVHCSVPARNVGSGTAVIRGLGVNISPEYGWSGKLSLAIVPPGEITRATFSIPKDRSELRELADAVLTGTFNVELRYTDVNGEQDTLTRLDVHTIESERSYVRQVHLFKPGEPEPFASSGPADQ